ncbi:MAG: hypothetical protein AAGI11_17275 [Pseudomonadota bacterium]
MSQADHQWEILGYDTRRVGKSITAAWRELLWGDESPLKLHLDEAVRLQGEDSERFVQSGADIDAAGSDGASRACDGILLPDELILGRTLHIPLAAEVDLPAVMALEVNSGSPFPADDTRSGWKVAARGDTQLTVHLVIVSVSAVMAYLGRQYDLHETTAREVWAEQGGSLVNLKGFGEHQRLQRYRGRLLRVAAMAGASIVLLVAISAIAAGGKYLELRKLEQASAQVLEESRDATSMREELAVARDTIGAVNSIVIDYPNPHLELERLTRLLGDEAYLTQWNMRGRVMKLRGRARDAAAIMKILTDAEAYAEVTSPQAWVRVGDTGLEQFYFNITLRGEDA